MLAVEREPAAEREHRDLAERGDRLQRRRGAGPGGARAASATRTASAAASARRSSSRSLLAEALHDPHAGDGLVDDAGDLAGLLLRVPASPGTPTSRSRSATTSSSGHARPA